MIKTIIEESICEKQLQTEIRLLQEADCPVILFGGGCKIQTVSEII